MIVVAAAPACTRPKPSAPAPSDPFAASGLDWTAPPAPGPPTRFAPPSIERFALPNGVVVFVAENHRLPLVAVTTLHLDAGARSDGALPGLAAVTLDVLDEDPHLPVELDRIGARLETSIAADYAAIRLVALSNHAADVVDLSAKLVVASQFDSAVVKRIRGEHAADLEQQRERPRLVAAQTFDHLVFGAHPYAQSAEGSPRIVAKLTLADVRAFHREFYRPDRAVVLIAGDVTRAAAEHAALQAFGTWVSSATAGPSPAPPSPQAPTATLAYVDVPGAAQTSVMIGRLGPIAPDPAADVANAMLGGMRASRLERELRDRLAITTGASSTFWHGAASGTWSIASTVRTETTLAAIQTALAIVDDLRNHDAPAEELAHAKTMVERTALEAFESTSGTVRALERIVVLGLPADHYATFIDRIRSIAPAEARAAIAELWTGLSIVVVGDWARLGDSLRTLGLPVAEYDASGARLQ
jgi:zinc protease